MRYDYDRAEILGKEVLKPCHGINVKVVRRLVHEDNVGVAEERLSKQNLDLFVTCKATHLSVHNALVKSETLHKL